MTKLSSSSLAFALIMGALAASPLHAQTYASPYPAAVTVADSDDIDDLEDNDDADDNAAPGDDLDDDSGPADDSAGIGDDDGDDNDADQRDYSGLDGEARCEAQFRSFEPGSGTYVTLDGDRVRCPYLD